MLPVLCNLSYLKVWICASYFAERHSYTSKLLRLQCTSYELFQKETSRSIQRIDHQCAILPNFTMTGMQRTEILGRLAVLILAILFCAIRFTDFFQHPDRVVEPYGDGFKAYTVIQYHARYDSQYHHFQGMNYPYGDHALSSATQPLISNGLAILSAWTGRDLSRHTIAVVNISMLLSLVGCSFFLFLILRRFELPVWLSTVAAIGIMMLTPQIARMTSHYGLSHAMVLPGLIYWLLRYDDKPGWLISLVVGIWVTVFSLVHFYYFAIMALTVSLFFAIRVIQRRDYRALLHYAFHYGLQIVLPLAFFIYWIYGQGGPDDRTDQPWGFFHFHSFPEGIFTSLEQPYWQWFDRQVFDLERTDINNFEGRSYIGLVAVFTILAMLVKWGVKRLKGGLLPLAKGQYFAHNMLITSGLLLVASFGIPFVWTGWEWLLDYTGPLRQFRSMGRFAWLFYYVINILSWVWLYHALKGKSYRWAIWIPAALLLWFEGINQAWAKNTELDIVSRFEEGRRFTDLNGIDYDDYQAILTVPYYNIGSDQFWWEGEGYILQNSLTLSLQTGLPTTSAMLTRTSRSQSLKQFQLVTEPYRVPAILADFSDDRPLLMMLDESEYKKEEEKYEHLLDGARLLYLEGDRLRMYEHPLALFERRVEDQVARVVQTYERDSTLVPVDTLQWPGFKADSSVVHFERWSFDQNGNTGFAYFGAGAQRHTMHPDSVLIEFETAGLAGNWVFSAWFLIDEDRRTRATLELIEKAPDGTVRQRSASPIRQHIDVFDDRGWGLGVWALTPQAADSRWEVRIQETGMHRETILVDECLWMPANRNLYFRTEAYYWWNNRFYPAD